MKNMLGQVVEKLVGLSDDKLKAIYDFLVKLASSRGTEWFTQFKLFLRKGSFWEKADVPPLLKTIETKEPFVLKKDDRYSMSDDFTRFDCSLDNDIAEIGNTKQEDVFIDMLQTTRGHATYVEIFSTINPNVKELCFTKKQLGLFVRKYIKWIEDSEHSLIVPLYDPDEDSEIFVASVYTKSLRVRIDRLGCTHDTSHFLVDVAVLSATA